MSDDMDDFEIPDDADMGDAPDSGDPPTARYLFRIEKMEMRKAGSNAKNPGKQFINVWSKLANEHGVTIAGLNVDAARIGALAKLVDDGQTSATAANQIAANADIITGVGPVTASAASVATTSGVRWMGNQVDQSAVNPTLVVASQVYHWEVPLKEIIADIDAGTTQGRAVIATLENKGITIQLNPDYPLDPSLAQRLTELTAEIVNGTITPPVR